MSGVYHPKDRSSAPTPRNGASRTADGPAAGVNLLVYTLDEAQAHTRGRRHRPSSRHICELLGYLERNEDMLVNYAAGRRQGEPISTAFVEIGRLCSPFSTFAPPC
jgi:hypothetical protein